MKVENETDKYIQNLNKSFEGNVPHELQQEAVDMYTG